MCIAILNTKGTLKFKTFKTCWNNNPDGAGLTYFDGKEIKIIKEMKDVKQFYDQYTKIREQYPAVDIAIHFRIATHGKINLSNCHPFKINNRAAFIHNGMINQVEKHHEHSDTHLFNELIMKKLPGNSFTNLAVQELLSSFIDYSKLVIISGEQSVIINEHLGHWNGENWYSNTSYKNEYKAAWKPTTATQKTANDSAKSWQEWEDYELPYKWDNTSKSYEKKEISCACCFNEEKVKYIPSWACHLCPECEQEFSADI